ncbi:MAG: MerR family transcriptional regulator [Deltaproteobacteria bacterium]|nr:MerR family transcriptional regulator [Deltaproteobacteria bacterium]
MNSGSNAPSSRPESPGTRIPDKLYFKIGEVSRITGVEPYVLRYWESEFESIQPSKLRNQRRYRRKDIERILEIRHLLYDQRFTIAGAKKRLREMNREPRLQSPAGLEHPAGQLESDGRETAVRRSLLEIRVGLESIRKMLE